jgi:tRNA-2-methylthio-N6-dimethylallyladenosine synthase
MPDLAVTTDIIVGFPGETEDDFVRTLEVAAEADFDSTFTFIFSPREGTEAATMVDHFVDPAVVADRFERLRAVVERSALLKHQARVGRIEEVIVEGASKRNEGVTTGRTRQGKLVHFPTQQPLRPGTFANVEITRGAPHFLEGIFREVTREATHRIRIPVSVH